MLEKQNLSHPSREAGLDTSFVSAMLRSGLLDQPLQSLIL